MVTKAVVITVRTYWAMRGFRTGAVTSEHVRKSSSCSRGTVITAVVY